jgi:hypothetical protein
VVGGTVCVPRIYRYLARMQFAARRVFDDLNVAGGKVS